MIRIKGGLDVMRRLAQVVLTIECDYLPRGSVRPCAASTGAALGNILAPIGGGDVMISGIVAVLRPACVAATIAIATMVIASLWGWSWVDWPTFWSLAFSYVALMLAGTAICFIDKSSRSGPDR